MKDECEGGFGWGVGWWRRVERWGWWPGLVRPCPRPPRPAATAPKQRTNRNNFSMIILAETMPWPPITLDRNVWKSWRRAQLPCPRPLRPPAAPKRPTTKKNFSRQTPKRLVGTPSLHLYPTWNSGMRRAADPLTQTRKICATLKHSTDSKLCPWFPSTLANSHEFDPYEKSFTRFWKTAWSKNKTRRKID